MHAVGIEFAPVVRDICVGVLQGPAQALDLQGRDLIAAGGFNGFVRFVSGGTAGCDHVAHLHAGQKSKPYYKRGRLSSQKDEH